MRQPPKIGSEAVLAELSRRDLNYFIRAMWPYYDPGSPWVDGWHVDAMAEHLTALYRCQIKRLIINVPPRTCKSSISSVLFPAWAWLQDPATAIVTSSYEYTLATRDSIKTRRLMDTTFYQRVNRKSEDSKEPIFKLHDRGVKSLARLKDTESWWENDQGGYRIALGVQGALTGKGGNILCVDDPQNPEEVSSEVERVRALTWWDQTMSTRTNDPKTERWLITMQRLHCFDFVGHEMEKNLGYVHLKLPMEFDSRKRCVTSLGVDRDNNRREWRDLRQQERDLLWPERFPRQTGQEKNDILATWR